MYMKQLTKEEKVKYFQKVTNILRSPEFKYDRDMSGADMEFLLNHIISGNSIQQGRTHLKKQFKMDDDTATRCIRKLMNLYKDLEDHKVYDRK